MLSNSEVAFISACDDCGAEVVIDKVSMTVSKESRTNVQARKVIQSFGADNAPKIAKALVETLEVR